MCVEKIEWTQSIISEPLTEREGTAIIRDGWGNHINIRVTC